ncbi:MAG TPA: type II toxin-antitoxin system RelE/ParE family toxin [bacterium]|nr:type II toxin-antitoxin system RelE/ParE family toxin [bacterium]
MPPFKLHLKTTKNISWIKGARRDFEEFPQSVQDQILDALSIVAEGYMPEIAKPLKGFGSGVYEIALRYRKDTYRTVYAVCFRDEIWVIHAFMKKSKTGTKTPQSEINLIRERTKRLKETFR